jgi:tetratricopeptide (TPR) repeat protein
MSAESQYREAYEAYVRGDLARAAQGFRAILRSKPGVAHNNLGVILTLQGRFDEAEACFREASQHEASAAQARDALALVLLGGGRYEEGWALWEARRAARKAAHAPPQGVPEWAGEDLAGRRLLVLGEEGLGDQMMFARYFPLLNAKGARIVFVGSPALRRLMAGLGVDVVDSTAQGEAMKPDLWVYQMSLPHRFGTQLSTIPPPAPLHLPAGSGGGVGVVTKGAAIHVNDDHRSLPPRFAQRLLRLGRDLSPEATGAADFLDTAQIVAGLDLVITVDTSMAHLAGALGKPVWILLPARATDWRWLRGRDDSPWYPTARLFRQRTAGDWEPVLRRVESALKDR